MGGLTWTDTPTSWKGYSNSEKKLLVEDFDPDRYVIGMHSCEGDVHSWVCVFSPNSMI